MQYEDILDAAIYAYKALSRLAAELDSNTLILHDAGSTVPCALQVLYPNQPTDIVLASDIPNLFLQSSRTALEAKTLEFCLLHLSAFKSTKYTKADVCSILGLEVCDDSFLTTVTADNLEQLVHELIAENSAKLEEYLSFANSCILSNLHRVVDTAILDHRCSRILYIGSYPELPWSRFLDGAPVAFEVAKSISTLEHQLLKLVFHSPRDPIPVFYSETGSFYCKPVDADADRSATLTDTLMNETTTLMFSNEVPEPSQSIEAVIEKLLKYAESTSYNKLSSGCYKNMRLVNSRLEEETGEYTESPSELDLVLDIADKEKLPIELCEPYKVVELCKPVVGLGHSGLTLALACIGISDGVVNARIRELSALDFVSEIVALVEAGATIIPDAKLTVLTTPVKSYAEAVNLLAANSHSEYFLMHDCSDPFSEEELANLMKEAARNPLADAVAGSLLCLQDVQLQNQAWNATEELYSTLYARRYLNLSSIVLKTRVFQYVQLDTRLAYNSQYEFLFRLVLSGADCVAAPSCRLLHSYELGAGKHASDKHNYGKYVEYVEQKHQPVANFVSQIKEQYLEYVRKISEIRNEAKTS